MKYKIIIYVFLALLLIAGVLVTIFSFKNKFEKEAYNNAKYYKFEIEKEKTRNGELQYTVQSLNVTNKELKEINVGLTNEIKNLNIKLQNVDNATQVEYQYIVMFDTIYVERTSNTDTSATFNCYYNDKYVELFQKLIYDKYCNEIDIDSLYLKLTDTLTIVNEILYNKCLFRRPIGYKLHIKSENPFINIDRIETYSLLKNNRKSKKKQ